MRSTEQTGGFGPQRGGYLIEPVVVRLDAHAVQDLLDVLGAGGGIAPEGGQQVGGDVAHPAARGEGGGVTGRPPTPTPAHVRARVARSGDPAEARLAPCPACPPSAALPARPAPRPARPTNLAAAEKPRACNFSGVRDGKEGAGAGGGCNSLPRSLRNLRAAPLEGAS